MREYEIALVLSNEGGLQAGLDALGQAGALNVFEGRVVPFRFAYPIAKHATGFFAFTRCLLSPERVEAITSGIRGTPHVLRFLVVSPPPQLSARNEKRPTSSSPRTSPLEQSVAPASPTLTNEALEQKLEEILK